MSHLHRSGHRKKSHCRESTSHESTQNRTPNLLDHIAILDRLHAHPLVPQGKPPTDVERRDITPLVPDAVLLRIVQRPRVVGMASGWRVPLALVRSHSLVDLGAGVVDVGAPVGLHTLVEGPVVVGAWCVVLDGVP